MLNCVLSRFGTSPDDATTFFSGFEKMIVSSFADVSAAISAHYNFSVDKFPMSGPDGLVSPHYGLWRSDTSECVGNAVSAKYNPHTTEDIVTLVEAARLAFDGELSLDMLWRQGHHLILKPTRESAVTIYGDDKIIPKLSIYGGFGGTPFMGDAGFHRYTCANLAHLTRVHNVSATIRHTASMRDKMQLLVAKFELLRASWVETQTQIREMNERRFSVAGFMLDLFGAPPTEGRGRTVAESRIEKILGRLVSERSKLGIPQDTDASGWMLWNAVQGYLQHDVTRKEANKTLRGLDTWNDPILAKAEALALGA